MKKRGQLTIFVIIAIILAFSIIIFFSLNTQKTIDSKDFLEGKGTTAKSEKVRLDLVDCIQRTSKQALITIGVQGGNYQKPNKNYDLGSGFFSYYYYEGDFLMPSREDIERSIERYTNKELEECLNKKDFALNTSFTALRTKVKIKENEVTFNIRSRITIKDEKKTMIINLEEKTFTQPSYLNSMIKIARYLTEYHNQDPKYFCINCLAEMAEKENVNVDIFPFIENNTRQVIIHEYETNAPNIYMFTYLNKYTGKEKSPDIDN